MDIKIIGGGPAGLAVAYYAKKRNLSFQVYESSNLVGGNCRTVSFDHIKYYLGPLNGMENSPTWNDDKNYKIIIIKR